jgi:hypothetical protein
MSEAVESGTIPSERYQRFSNLFVSHPPGWSSSKRSDGVIWKRLYDILACMLREEDDDDSRLELKRSGKVGLYETFDLLLKLEKKSGRAKLTADTLQDARGVVHVRMFAHWASACDSEKCDWSEEAGIMIRDKEEVSSLTSHRSATATGLSTPSVAEGGKLGTGSQHTHAASRTPFSISTRASELESGRRVEEDAGQRIQLLHVQTGTPRGAGAVLYSRIPSFTETT